MRLFYVFTFCYVGFFLFVIVNRFAAVQSLFASCDGKLMPIGSDSFELNLNCHRNYRLNWQRP